MNSSPAVTESRHEVSSAEAGASLRHFFYLVREYRNGMALIFISTLIITGLIYLFSARIYKSEATFVINESPYEFATDPRSNTADISKLLIQSLISGIESKDMQLILAEQLQVPSENLCFIGVTPRINLSEPNTAKIEVQPVRNSRVAVISVYSATPSFALKVAQTLMDEVESLNVIVGRISSVSTDLKVIQEKTDRLADALVTTTSDRIRLEQQVQGLDAHLAQGASLESYPPFQADENLRNFMLQEAIAEGNYHNLASSTIHNSSLAGKMSEVNSLKNQISSYAKELALALRSGLAVSKAREVSLDMSLQEQKQIGYALKNKIDKLTQAVGNYQLRRDPNLFDKNSATEKASVIVVIDRPQLPQIPTQPNALLDFIIGIFTALFFAIGAVVFIHYFDHSLKNPRQLKLLRNIDCLAILPEPSSQSLNQPFGPAPDPESVGGFSYLRNRILRSALTGTSQKIFVFIGLGSHSESAEFVSKLALMLAKSEKRVLIVDLNFHDPQIPSILGIKPKKGLTEWFFSDDPIEDYITSSVIRELAVISAGRISENVDDLISRRPLLPVLTKLQKEWDFILIHADNLLERSHLLLASPAETPLIAIARYADANLDDLDILIQHSSECQFAFAGVVIHHYPQKRLHSHHAAYELGEHRYLLNFAS